MPQTKGQKPQKRFEDQFDDEEVLFVFRKHPIVMRKGLVLACLGPLLGVLPAAIRPTLGFGYFFGGLAAGFALGALMMLTELLRWGMSRRAPEPPGTPKE